MQSACLNLGRSFLPPTSIATLDIFVSQAACQIGKNPDAAADISLAAAKELLSIRDLNDDAFRQVIANLVTASCQARDTSLRA